MKFSFFPSQKVIYLLTSFLLNQDIILAKYLVQY